MLGGYISDLEKGDVFKPVEYVITPFMCSEYAHGTRGDERVLPLRATIRRAGRSGRRR